MLSAMGHDFDTRSMGDIDHNMLVERGKRELRVFSDSDEEYMDLDDDEVSTSIRQQTKYTLDEARARRLNRARERLRVAESQLRRHRYPRKPSRRFQSWRSLRNEIVPISRTSSKNSQPANAIGRPDANLRTHDRRSPRSIAKAALERLQPRSWKKEFMARLKDHRNDSTRAQFLTVGSNEKNQTLIVPLQIQRAEALEYDDIVTAIACVWQATDPHAYNYTFGTADTLRLAHKDTPERSPLSIAGKPKPFIIPVRIACYAEDDIIRIAKENLAPILNPGVNLDKFVKDLLYLPQDKRVRSTYIKDHAVNEDFFEKFAETHISHRAIAKIASKGHNLLVIVNDDLSLNMLNSSSDCGSEDEISRIAMNIVRNTKYKVWEHGTPEFSKVENQSVRQQSGDHGGIHVILSAWAYMLKLPLTNNPISNRKMGRLFYAHALEVINLALAGYMNCETIQAFLNAHGFSDQPIEARPVARVQTVRTNSRSLFNKIAVLNGEEALEGNILAEARPQPNAFGIAPTALMTPRQDVSPTTEETRPKVPYPKRGSVPRLPTDKELPHPHTARVNPFSNMKIPKERDKPPPSATNSSQNSHYTAFYKDRLGYWIEEYQKKFRNHQGQFPNRANLPAARPFQISNNTLLNEDEMSLGIATLVLGINEKSASPEFAFGLPRHFQMLREPGFGVDPNISSGETPDIVDGPQPLIMPLLFNRNDISLREGARFGANLRPDDETGHNVVAFADFINDPTGQENVQLKFVDSAMGAVDPRTIAERGKAIVRHSRWLGRPSSRPPRPVFAPSRIYRSPQQRNSTACGLHVIFNAWVFALGLHEFFNPDFIPDNTFYEDGVRLVNLSLAGECDTAVITAWLVSSGYVYNLVPRETCRTKRLNGAGDLEEVWQRRVSFEMREEEQAILNQSQREWDDARKRSAERKAAEGRRGDVDAPNDKRLLSASENLHDEDVGPEAFEPEDADDEDLEPEDREREALALQILQREYSERQRAASQQQNPPRTSTSPGLSSADRAMLAFAQAESRREWEMERARSAEQETRPLNDQRTQVAEQEPERLQRRSKQSRSSQEIESGAENTTPVHRGRSASDKIGVGAGAPTTRTSAETITSTETTRKSAQVGNQEAELLDAALQQQIQDDYIAAQQAIQEAEEEAAQEALRGDGKYSKE